jgi:ABC-type nitrate/sulfonate/bicarbonate transport system permease component
MAGIRIGLGFAVTGMVVINMISSKDGLGYYIVSAQAQFDVLGTWAGLFMIAIIGLAANITFALAERRILAWHRGWRAAQKASG